MSLTDALVPGYIQMLGALSMWLKKGQKQFPADAAEALLSARLAPDMFPLTTQIRFACFQAQEATYRLRGEAVSAALEELALEGRNAGERPGTINDAQVRIGEALALLNDLGPDVLDAGAQRAITLELPGGIIFDLTGEQYVRDWALPQFHFHLVTAYAILRSQGVDLGKADYVPHMFAYLRPAGRQRVDWATVGFVRYVSAARRITSVFHPIFSKMNFWSSKDGLAATSRLFV